MWTWLERAIGRGPEYWAAKNKEFTRVMIVPSDQKPISRDYEIARWRELYEVLEDVQKQNEERNQNQNQNKENKDE